VKAYQTTTVIRAPRTRIWSLLTDAEAYPSWNTTVDKVEGRIEVGQKIKVFAKLQPGRAFPVKVEQIVPNERMVWASRMPLGLFEGERTFTLEETADGVRFAMREVFRGLMFPLIGKSIPDLQPAFDEFAAALKRRAEAG
jgi:hypothetical protein